MEISEVRVKLIGNPTDRLKAFASVTLDGDFVIRDIKVIDGTDGVFVAMPSRKLADRCPKCKSKNHLRAKFCNECGTSLDKGRVPRDRMGRVKLHADIAHPINSACRKRLQDQIVEAFKTESERSTEPGYEPPSDDEFDYETDAELEPGAEETVVDDVSDTAVDTDDSDNANDIDDDADDDDNDDGEGDSGGGYADLIAELRRDAADRRGAHGRDDRSKPAPERDRPEKRKVENVPLRDEPRKKPESAPVRSEPAPHRHVAEQPDDTDDFGAGIL